MKPTRITFHELSIEISEETKIPLSVVKTILNIFALKLNDSIKYQYNISLPHLNYQARTRQSKTYENKEIHIGVFKSKEEPEDRR